MAMYPLDVVVVGTALNTFGFIGNDTVAGLGLNTFGFLWPCDAIWTPIDSPLTTTWVASSVSSLSTETCIDDTGGLG